MKLFLWFMMVGVLALTSAEGQGETSTTPTPPPPTDPCDSSLSNLERLQAMAGILSGLDACLESVLSGISGTPDQPTLSALSNVRFGCQTMVSRIDAFVEGQPPPPTPPGEFTVVPADPCDPSLSNVQKLQAIAAVLSQLDACLQTVLSGTTGTPDQSVVDALNAMATKCQVMIARIDVFLSAVPRGPEPLPPAHVWIVPIQEVVDELAAQYLLDTGRHNALSTELQRSLVASFEGNAVEVLRRLKHFLNKTSDFVQEGALPPQHAQYLIALANSAAGQVRRSAFAPIQVHITDTGVLCPSNDCVRTTFHVAPRPPNLGGGIEPVPDGSAERPYHTILDALDRAAADGVCGVTIRVAGGCYSGDLVITRHTWILGSRGVLILGSIINHGPHELRVHELTLARASQACALPAGSSDDGAIQVDHPCASTILTQVRIEGAQKFGIRQSAGTLSARGVTILDTQAVPFNLTTGAGLYLTDGVTADLTLVDVRRSQRYGIRQKGGTLQADSVTIEDTLARAEFTAAGTGVWLSDGVTAVLDDVEISRSGSSALVVEDADTDVTARHLDVRDTRVNRHLFESNREHWETNLPASLVAVEVLQDGRLQMEWSEIADNEVVGLRAWDRGRVELIETDILRTKEVADPRPGHEGEEFGGVNVQAIDNGTMDITDFRCADAELCGVHLARGGEIDLHWGRVEGNEVGASVHTEGFDVGRLQDNVIFGDNDRDLDGDPPPPEPLPGL